VDLELDNATKEYFFENIDENNKYLDKYNDIVALSKKKSNLDIPSKEMVSNKMGTSTKYT